MAGIICRYLIFDIVEVIFSTAQSGQLRLKSQYCQPFFIELSIMGYC